MSTPYAIIKSGSKQYRVAEGDFINVDLLKTEGTVTFDQVLFVFDGSTSHVGVPTVSGFKVMGELVGLAKGPKVLSYKYRRRKNSRKTIGHRQHYTRVKITQITG